LQVTYTATVESKLTGSCTQISQPVIVVFEPPPSVSIEQIVNTTLCDVQSVGLKVVHNDGAVEWSTGETADQISVSTAGSYRATVTSEAGCSTDASIDIQFFPNPVLSIPHTNLCENLKEIVTLEAPAGYSKYTWNGMPGTNTFSVNKPQTIVLSVTDVNGCQSSQTIIVSSKCAVLPPSKIFIPNTFTPNGDGINDTWVISGLETDPSALVRVFNRYGIEVYKSTGYGKAWDGQYDGKKLPSGVYYYINGNKETFSGSVTILH